MPTHVIQDLYILSDSGIVLFSRVFNPKVNEQLFGALMSALNTFATELTSGGLTSFELSSIRFTIMKNDRYMFVCNSSKKVKEKHVIDELRRISERFLEHFTIDLENWDGDISLFEGFEENIEDSLVETIKKFQRAFW